MAARQRLVAPLLAIALGCGVTGAAHGQSTNAPVTALITPVPACGAADALCRIVADKLGPLLGQTIVVESRAGAGGTIATSAVSRAAPDGRTLFCAPEYIFISHLLSPGATDPLNLEPVSLLATYPTVIVSRSTLPVATFPKLIDHARANPGRLNFASQGNGSMAHLILEAMKIRAGVEVAHVPYRGGAPAVTDILAGHVDLYAGPLPGVLEHIRAGKVRLIAPVARERLSEFPNVATTTELLPGFEAAAFLGIAAPPATPKPIVEAIAAGIDTVLKMPDVRARFDSQQARPSATSPAEMRRLVGEYVGIWQPVIAKARITSN